MAEQEKEDKSRGTDQAQKIAEQYPNEVREAANAMQRTMRARRACAVDPQRYKYERIF